MWSVIVEIFFPGSWLEPSIGFADDLGLIQILVAKAAVEALAQPVLPRCTWLDVEHLDADRAEPLPDGLGDELGTVVAAQALWVAVKANRMGDSGAQGMTVMRRRRTFENRNPFHSVLLDLMPPSRCISPQVVESPLKCIALLLESIHRDGKVVSERFGFLSSGSL